MPASKSTIVDRAVWQVFIIWGVSTRTLAQVKSFAVKMTPEPPANASPVRLSKRRSGVPSCNYEKVNIRGAEGLFSIWGSLMCGKVQKAPLWTMDRICGLIETTSGEQSWCLVLHLLLQYCALGYRRP